MRSGILLLLTASAIIFTAFTRPVPLCPDTKWEPCRKQVKPYQPTECEKGIDQGALNTVDLLDIALTNNPLTQQSWRAARAAAFNLGVFKSALWPTIEGNEILDAQAIYGEVGAALERGRTQSVTHQIVLTYLLWDFGGRNADIAAACYAMQTANWSHNRTLQDVMIITLRAYYDHVYAQGLVEARESDVKDATRSFEAADQQYQAGVATRIDSLQARSTLADFQIQLAVAQGQSRISLGRIASAIGWPADSCFSVSMAPENLPMDAVCEGVNLLIQAARDTRPDLDAAYTTYLEAKARVQSEISSALPTIGITGIAQRQKVWDNPLFSGSSQAGVATLNVPIFAGGLYESRICRAKEVASSLKAAWKVRENDAQLEVLTAYYTYTSAIETLQYTQDFLSFAQEAYDAAMEGYKVGISSILDVLNAQTNLSSARTKYLQARTTLMVSIANIAYAVGTL